MAELWAENLVEPLVPAKVLMWVVNLVGSKAENLDGVKVAQLVVLTVFLTVERKALKSVALMAG